MLVRAIPFIFVILWASGFVGGRLGLQYAEPATLLLIRVASNAVLFFFITLMLRRHFPRGKLLLHNVVVGALIQCFYLGGTYFAIDLGMPAGLSSLLVGSQPILTALLLVLFASERFRPSQWLGLALGFIGISLVLMGNMTWQSEQHKWLAVGWCVIALLGITIGTLYQKKWCGGSDMFGGAAAQYLVASALFLPYAMRYETMQVEWTPIFIFTVFWLVVVLSGIAMVLLLYMVKHGAASSVASVFYLVPPVTAIQAWLVFDESFDVYGLLGFVFSACAVYLVVRKPRSEPEDTPENPSSESQAAESTRAV